MEYSGCASSLWLCLENRTGVRRVRIIAEGTAPTREAAIEAAERRCFLKSVICEDQTMTIWKFPLAEIHEQTIANA